MVSKAQTPVGVALQAPRAQLPTSPPLSRATHPNDAVQLPHGHLLGPFHGLKHLLLVLPGKAGWSGVLSIAG